MINDLKHDRDENARDRDRAHDHKQKNEPGRSIAARFRSTAEAREAIAALHKSHYTHTWLGTTSLATTDGGDEAVTVESGGFFSQTQSLIDALVSHGVLGDTARALEATIEPGDALVTVDPKDRDARDAIALLEQHGGQIAGHTITVDTGMWIAPSQSRTTPVGEHPTMERFSTEDTFSRRGQVTR